MKRWCVLATVAALVLALAPSAAAETVQLPVGEIRTNVLEYLYGDA